MATQMPQLGLQQSEAVGIFQMTVSLLFCLSLAPAGEAPRWGGRAAGRYDHRRSVSLALQVLVPLQNWVTSQVCARARAPGTPPCATD